MPPFSTSWAMRSGGFQEVLFRNCCGRHDLRMDNAQHEHHYERAQYLAERYSLEKTIIIASLRVHVTLDNRTSSAIPFSTVRV